MMLLTIILTACGGGANNNNSAKGNQALTVAPSPQGDFSKNFNPIAAQPTYGTQGYIFETLLYFNRVNGSIKPWLAEDYKFSDDAKTLTFKLRQNVKWNDGQPFTAEDVVFTLELPKKNPAADTGGLWTWLKDVTMVDAHTVTVTLKQAYTPILWQLGGSTYILPKHVWEKVDDPIKFINDNPVGTGPYKLKSFTPQLVTLAKNDQYWQEGKPQVKEIRVVAFSSNTNAELALSRGEIDWTGLFIPDIDKTFVSKNKDHHHYWFPPSNVIVLYMNLTKAPFNDLKVRQALSYAIDRAQIVKDAENGYTVPASPTGLVLPNEQKYLASEYQNLEFKQDMEKAKQLLESAGFKKGSDGIYAGPDGKKLSFNINVVSGWTDWVTAAQIISKNLKELGIQANVNTIAYNAYFNALQLGTYETSISWTNNGPTPYFLLEGLLHSTRSADIGKAAVSNFERWKDAETDKLLDQYATTTNEDKQKEAIQGIQKIMVEKLPVVPLFYGPTWYEYNSSRFTGWPDKDNAYSVPAPFTYPDAAVTVLNLKPAQ
ncbi:peptide ABC transporter substrate-binding protein [Thermosporothrix hazakensis]|jgi:peptide/nickel transport system substrate-binding protein|nr:peptide ABC transporter substrate-binding protein [Thermosporothrix sp. COM3]GCE45854.1 peptide ABC transporter substrate-binding protein [Thermosporothrix hazakensis]